MRSSGQCRCDRGCGGHRPVPAPLCLQDRHPKEVPQPEALCEHPGRFAIGPLHTTYLARWLQEWGHNSVVRTRWMIWHWTLQHGQTRIMKNG
ncbi:hypothetical protein H5410_030906 [Solanum commersonii]|uniref:Uncharacterized protein n=1 Tax=Solanum commersonii TaxID=4109 RepID=A0A9J5YIR6_SOLCO|nr:hypothetical protein H5410_030906 [Solanum commersonii]